MRRRTLSMQRRLPEHLRRQVNCLRGAAANVDAARGLEVAGLRVSARLRMVLSGRPEGEVELLRARVGFAAGVYPCQTRTGRSRTGEIRLYDGHGRTTSRDGRGDARADDSGADHGYARASCHEARCFRCWAGGLARIRRES